jgi:hypothetical protein
MTGYAPEALSYVTPDWAVGLDKDVKASSWAALPAKAFEANKTTADAMRPVNK